MAGRKEAVGATAGPTSPSASSSPMTGATKTKSTASQSRAQAHSRLRTHRGLTCANCRTRKTRCDGSQPTCKTCEVYRDTCRYEKPPPMSQIVTMARRLQEAEETVAALRAELAATKSAAQPARAMAIAMAAEATTTAQQAHPLPTSPPFKHEGNTDISASTSTADRPTPTTSRRPSQDLLFDLSVDSNGKLCYVGPTSAVHNPPDIEAHTSPIQTYDDAQADVFRDTSRPTGGSHRLKRARLHHQTQEPRPSNKQTPDRGDTAPTTKADVRALLTTRAIEARAWEAFALASAADQTDLPRAALARLLQIHWVWIAPMFMWVYRPAFMRDMARGEGKYYSPLLLIVLCGHAARFEETAEATAATAGGSTLLGDALISRARLLLGAEIHKPSTIPTVQALLQLSARDLAYGHISQAWLYSGMAFRMVSDLGLQHSSSGQLLGLGQLGAEDLEVRRRLYWSCYFWDKAMSLYLGRMPTLVDLPPDASPDLLDDFAEHELWRPPAPASSSPSGNTNSGNPLFGRTLYPPVKSHAISCFANTCRLAVILSDIVLQLYSRRRPAPSSTASTSAASIASVQRLRDRLDAWRAATPSHLLIADPDHTTVCPPPHILTQNLLYYTTLILLHRPFYSSAVHHATCRDAADQLERLLLLLERTFGFHHITYLMAYCVYTGASVLVQDMKQSRHRRRQDTAAASKIQTFLRALRQGMASCPLVRRSLDIITASLGNSRVVSIDRDEDEAAATEIDDVVAAAVPPATVPDPVMAVSPPPPQPQPRPPPLDDSASSSGSVPPDPLSVRNYLPAFPYYHSELGFFDGAGSGVGNIPTNANTGFNTVGSIPPAVANGHTNPTTNTIATFSPAGDTYDLAAMDIDAFSLLDCFPENNVDSATAFGWYMPP
ncbi:uncharacterized protein SPSK_07014 [Sporothrix schenckii 1099-18]|uniref:Zn(2)-C6 fungal-type domain-containing protein n=1 Tax=Sporothrix schenckii 1099-18 TaxID=1397361 RepID=A0A0F2MIV2_SPOSC|nr:uncharacterized protein SPSK_07014 [Sporothrix schenckii 1099-18]KJR88101.1 hypothetical protein SPSK_07014 [Sporothrix schenckii 1099-18]